MWSQNIIDPSGMDISYMEMPSQMLIANLARMAGEHDVNGEISSSRSLLDAAEKVQKLVPDPVCAHMMNFIPDRIVKLAVDGIDPGFRLLHSLNDDAGFAKGAQGWAQLGCPLCFLAAQGVSRIEARLSTDELHKLLDGKMMDIDEVSPADNAYIAWEKAEERWEKMVGILPITPSAKMMFQSLKWTLRESIPRTIRLQYRWRKNKDYSVMIDLFAWSAQVSEV
jgi:hypothetical protein